MKQTHICFLIIYLLFMAFNATAQKNLISNGSFENELSGWSGNAKISNFIYHSGGASLALVSINKGKWEGVDQKIKLPKNAQAILVAGSCKADGIEAGSNSWNTAVIIVEFFSGDKKIGSGERLAQKTGTENWTAFKKALKVPSEATAFKVIIALSEATGTFFVDNLTAITISPDDIEGYNTSSSIKN